MYTPIAVAERRQRTLETIGDASIVRALSATPARDTASRGAVVLAAALPFVLLHRHYQPTLSVRAVDVMLSDVAILVVVATAVVVGARDRFAALRAGLPLWIAAAAFLCWIGVATVYGSSADPSYETGRHLVTAAKFAEYALLAPAAAVLVRTRSEAILVLTVLVAWCTAAALLGVLQYVDLVPAFDNTPAWQRRPSFLGYHDLGVLGGAVVAVGLAAIVRSRGGLGAAASAAGGLAVVVGASVAALLGIVAAAALVVAATRTRVLTVAAVVAVVAAGVVLVRAGDLDQFARYIGVRPRERTTTEDVQTYAQRSLLAYIGLQIWLDHPVLGRGWQASREHATYAPYLADAHREFPDQPALAFPSRRHPWGVQNAYIQALSDLGAIGLVLLAGVFGAGLWVGVRAAWRRSFLGLAGVGIVLVAMGVWTAVGLVAGIPLDAMTWLGLGLSVAAANGA